METSCGRVAGALGTGDAEEWRVSEVSWGHGKLPVLQCSTFLRFSNVVHAVSTRRGGCSRGRYATLNVGHGVGDDPACVQENLERLRRALGFSDLFFLTQEHGGRVVVAEEEQSGAAADAVISREPGLGLLVRQADCAAVVLYDPVARAVANVHSGWRGIRANIVGRTVRALCRRFGASPGRIRAFQGPSLGPCCAEYRDYGDRFPPHWEPYRRGEARFDFWTLIEDQLVEAGVPRAFIRSSRICTRCCSGDFFSYRAARVTGRFGTVVGLRRFGTGPGGKGVS